MNNKPLWVSIIAFVLALALAATTATVLAGVIERRTTASLRAALETAGLGWVSVAPDGLRVALSGTAPTESARIRALQVAGSVVDAARVDDAIVVPVGGVVVNPVFRIEVMRNRDTVSVIGLVPAGVDGDPIRQRVQSALPGVTVDDMVQTADHPIPHGWVSAVDFALAALDRFAVGRISVTAGRIEVSALVDSPEARRDLEAALREIAPRGQVLILDLTAPRPVVTPFVLRVELGSSGLRVIACSADTEAAQAQIGAALTEAGFTGRLACPLALGAPSPRWGQAAATAIAALARLGVGTLTISDGRVAIEVPHTVPQADFDRAAGRLETALPDAFTLAALRLPPPAGDAVEADSVPEVTLTLTEAGAMSIAGRLPDARIREATTALARARFGTQAVEVAARLDPALPQGWSVRVLTAIEAMAELHHGQALVRADRFDVRGVSGNPDAAAQVTQVIVAGLGGEAAFTVDVRYDEALDPVVQAPTPEVCESRIHEILRQTKITFDPGSIEINAASGQVIDRIAEVLRECGELPFEVGGHTDSQGRDETNLNLSQARAEAVINALLARRVLVASLTARGYGSSRPIADNGTEAGREANRRIEFTLVRPEPEPEPIDPALEAQLVFEIRTPDADTIRPQPRPGDDTDSDAEIVQGSGD